MHVVVHELLIRDHYHTDQTANLCKGKKDNIYYT